MTESEAIELVREVRRLKGHSYKKILWRCFWSGAYERDGLGSLSAKLEELRMSFGPGWITTLKLPKEK